MREEGFMSGSDDVRLTVEIVVASSQVGRIIGKGGQNVRELQRVTGSLIKLPEQSQQQQGSQQQDHDTTVHIVGPFYSVQSAQRRIRAMVAQASAPGRRRAAAASAAVNTSVTSAIPPRALTTVSPLTPAVPASIGRPLIL
ncbi:insulin-like growth factor 2 mRNA-binding protein 2 [Manduca sexta]|uniref:insulin-like growth factor 2 mRNA-binding protein 2 n=1 Tax=Manduca sexta TaxID=7130 RepID=UPI00188E36EB|nr:insulin-like growth factor 2 mRNA-binding protein 2 [Manduca sexta]